MALANYTELLAAVTGWALRADLAASVPDCITLAESRLNRLLPLRVMETETALTGTPSSRLIALPADYVEPINLYLTTFGSLQWLKPLASGTMDRSAVNGTPSGWMISGANIEVNSPLDQAHTFLFRYRASFSLSVANPTNWLMTNHPDVYLWACLVELEAFDKNGPVASVWDGRLMQAIDEVAYKESRSQAIGELVVDPALVVVGGFDINTGLPT